MQTIQAFLFHIINILFHEKENCILQFKPNLNKYLTVELLFRNYTIFVRLNISPKEMHLVFVIEKILENIISRVESNYINLRS